MKINPSVKGLEELRDATGQIDKKWRPAFMQQEKEAARLEAEIHSGLVKMMGFVYTAEDTIQKIQSHIDEQEGYEWTDEEISARNTIAEIREWCFNEVPFYIRKGSRMTLDDMEAFANGADDYSDPDIIQALEFSVVDGRRIFKDPDYGIEMEVLGRKDSNGRELPVDWSGEGTQILTARATSNGLAQLEDLISEAHAYLEQLKDNDQELRYWIEETNKRRADGRQASRVLTDSAVARYSGKEQ